MWATGRFAELTIDVDRGGGRTVVRVLAVLLLCAVAFVVVRSLVAHSRGEDVRRAALSSFRAVAPPLVIAGAGVVALAIFIAVAGLVLGMAAIISLIGGADGLGTIFLAFLVGVVVLGAVVVGAVTWGLVRAVRSSRRRR